GTNGGRGGPVEVDLGPWTAAPVCYMRECRTEKEGRIVRALSLLSGGIDSSTVTTIAAEKHGPKNVLAVTFDYGQTLRSELEAARTFAECLVVRHRVVHIASAFTRIRSALLEASGIALPHVEHAVTLPPTNVPFRNGIFLSVLAGMAMSIGAGA